MATRALLLLFNSSPSSLRGSRRISTGLWSITLLSHSHTVFLPLTSSYLCSQLVASAWIAVDRRDLICDLASSLFAAFPLVFSHLVTHYSSFVVKLCIKVNVKTWKICNLQGVSFYSLLQWRQSTTVRELRMCTAWKLAAQRGSSKAPTPSSLSRWTAW